MGIQLELQFDLCAEDPQQLTRIVDVYSAVKVNSIKTEIRRAMNKVRTTCVGVIALVDDV